MSQPTQTEPCANAPAAPAEIDASCRVPVLFLFASAAIWLVASGAIGLIASLKMHQPLLLVRGAELTYGRVFAAASNAFLFGFAAQAILGVTLWMLARLGGTSLVRPLAALIGAVVWNLAATAGVVGILIGDSSGYEGFEFPRYAVPALLLAYTVIALCALATYFNRRERDGYVSQWYLLAALFALPWAYLSVHSLLLVDPVRGVAQAAINWWAGAVLREIWLGGAALAVIFYLVPRLLDRPLYSRGYALVGFWMLLILGGWTGLHLGAPLPLWMVRLGEFASLLLLFSLFAVAWNLHVTAGGQPVLGSDCRVLRFAGFALFIYLLATLLVATGPLVSAQVQFTYFTAAVKHLALYGAFAFAMFAAIYHIVPRLAAADWPCARGVKWHYTLAVAGVLLVALPLALAGWRQGMSLMDPAADFNEVARRALMAYRVGTIGELLWLAGGLLMLGNLMRLFARRFCPCTALACTMESKGGAR
jgi:cytochrome c oxidase cbb3-type subunit 1